MKNDTVTRSEPEELVDDKNVPHKSRLSDTKTVVICFLGIFISFIFFGLLQEKITRGEYGPQKERFRFTFSLVICQCIVYVIFAKIASLVTSSPIDAVPTKYYMGMAFSYVGAMAAGSDALKYVSYPTQALGKSAKPIPMMILGVLMAKKRYTLKKYLFVFMIVIGVALFIYKPSQQHQHKKSYLWYGELLLLLSLFLDGFTGGTQERLRGKYVTNAYSMMYRNNAWAVVYLLIASIGTGELWGFLAFTQKYPHVIWQLMGLSLCGCVGNNFIYITVTRLGPLTCSIITTTRKFFTIICSVIIFGHSLTLLQCFATLLVFTGLTLDAIQGKSAPK